MVLGLFGGAPASAESGILESLEGGWVSLQTKQIDDESFFLGLEIQAEGVVAALVTSPNDGEPMLRIELEAYSELIEAVIGPRQAQALVTLTADELKGHLQHRLVYDGRKLEALVVSLVTLDGELQPLTIRSRGFASGQKHTIEFGGRCLTVRLTCTRPDGSACDTPRQCCGGGGDYCGDCASCTITCPPCSKLQG